MPHSRNFDCLFFLEKHFSKKTLCEENKQSRCEEGKQHESSIVHLFGPNSDTDLLASIDKQLVIEQDACTDPHNVDKHLIVDHAAHILRAVDSGRANEKRARQQDPEDANLNKTGEGEDKKALRFQAQPFSLSSCSGGSDTYQFKYVQDVLSCNKQDFPSVCVSLEASGQSIDGSSRVHTGVVISIYDAIIREQQLSNIVVADTSAGTNIDRFCKSSGKIIICFLRSFLIKFRDHEICFTDMIALTLFVS